MKIQLEQCSRAEIEAIQKILAPEPEPYHPHPFFLLPGQQADKPVLPSISEMEPEEEEE